MIYFTAVVLLIDHTNEAQAVPSSCTNTWFRQGIKSRLDIDWNTPLPVFSTDTIKVPAPGPESDASPTVQLSESEITDEYSGIINITISDLQPGQRIILEKYMVTDPVRGVDESSLLQASYLLQDGYTPLAGEVYNFNVPNDFSHAVGEIMAQLDFYKASPSTIVGHYVYRVKSPTNAYVPTDVSFQVHAKRWDQQFQGRVTSDGVPVSNAFVVLLDPLGLDNDFIKGTMSDADGNYVLFADWDEYDLVALAPGFVSRYGRNVSHFIDEKETLTVDISLTRGDRTVSGTLIDADHPEMSLPGVEILLFSLSETDEIDTDLFTICWTDHEGNFSAKVTEGRWGIVPRLQAVYDLGYVSPGLELGAVVDASQGDSNDNVIQLQKGESIIWGTLSSSQPDQDGIYQPLQGVEIRAIRSDDGAAAHAVTDGDGDYRLAVGPGYWNVFAVPYSLYDNHHTSPFPSDLKVPSARCSLLYDFTARAVDAWVYGWAEDENGDAIGKFELRAVNFSGDYGEQPFQNTYDTDGFFEFGLAHGDWIIVPEPIEAARRQLIFSGLPRVLVEPQDSGEAPVEIEVELNTMPDTGTLSLFFNRSDGSPIPDIRVHGMMIGNGQPELHSFGLSDATGKAKIAIRNGTWEFHPSDIDLRDHGLIEIYTFEIKLHGGDQEHRLIPRPKQGINPRLNVHHTFEPSSPRFSGIGESGQRYIVEVSRNLDEWREFGRVIAESGSFTINDYSESTSPTMFIRARPE